MMDVDGLRLPLLWHAAPRPGDNDGSEVRASALGSSTLAGRKVRLRLHFRDATIFALGAGSSDVAHATRSLKTEDRDAAPPLPLLRATEFGPTSLPATWGSAYLSNGVVGLRVGPNPLQQNSTQGMVGGEIETNIASLPAAGSPGGAAAIAATFWRIAVVAQT